MYKKTENALIKYFKFGKFEVIIEISYELDSCSDLHGK